MSWFRKSVGNLWNRFVGVRAKESMEVAEDTVEFVREEVVTGGGDEEEEETEVERLRREIEELKRRLLIQQDLEVRMERLEQQVSLRFSEGESENEKKIKELEVALEREREEKFRLIDRMNSSGVGNNEVDVAEEESSSPVRSSQTEEENEEDEEVTSQSQEEERENGEVTSESDAEEQEVDSMSLDDEDSNFSDGNNLDEDDDDLEVTAAPVPRTIITRSFSRQSTASSTCPPLTPTSGFQSSMSTSSPELEPTTSSGSSRSQQTRRKSTRKSLKSLNFTSSSSGPAIVKRTLPLPPVSFSSTERNKSRRQRHAVDKSKLNLGWYCICSGSFAEQGQLTEHISYFNMDPKFPCPKCPKRWTRLNYLRGHLRSRHKVADPYPGAIGCADCGKISANREEHKAHRLANHPRWTERIKKLLHGIDHTFLSAQNRFRCLCTREFGKMRYLKAHVLGYTAPGRFRCDECPSSFSSHNALCRHSERVHKKSPDPRIRNGIPRSRTYGCNQCAKIVQSRKELQQHKQRQHGIIAWNQKQAKMADPATRSKKHGCGPSSSEKSRGFRCFCGRGYSTKKELQAHITRTRPRVPFKCPHCPVDFSEHARLAKHIRLIHKKKDYEAFGCTTCGTTWPSRIALRRHQESQGHRRF